MPPHDARDPRTGITYEEMMRTVYFAVVGDVVNGKPGLIQRVDDIEEERQQEREGKRLRIDRFFYGVMCGAGPTILALVIEHFWK